MISFDTKVPPGGYAWWYIDGVSDDKTQALTMIAFVGSVFSPYYAWANRRQPGGADPENYVALNVALYHPSGHSWAMTERRRAALSRTANHIGIGPSRIDWDGNSLTAQIAEMSAPVPRTLRGTITLTANATHATTYDLDAAGAHRWQPIAPCARIRVAFDNPALSWKGDAYLDHNIGDAPVATAFRDWHWSRAVTRTGATIFYHANRRDGSTANLALGFTRSGDVTPIEAPPRSPLPITAWRLRRETRSDADRPARLLRNLEDTPFYARARIAASVDGEAVEAIHETLDLDRLNSRIVQVMLPFRMPRRIV